MIEVRGLSKSFGGQKVVDDVSFTLNRGETLVLIGPSGCGKTTTLKMINRLIEPDEGQVFIDGREIRSVNPVQLRRQIGYVIQQNNLFPHYTVRENIWVVPKLLKKTGTDLEKRLEEMLELVELPAGGFLDKYPRQLSGGQQQRVAIARALMAQPPLLLMDEPFSALDPLTRIGVRDNFRQLYKWLQTTTILVTHDIGEAVLLGDRICLLNHGQVMQCGPPVELIFSPVSDFVKSFFNHDRFDMEMQVISILELLPYLNFKRETKTDFLKAKSDDRVYSILNKLAENAWQWVSLDLANEGSVFFDQGDILMAFNEFKSSKTKGG